MGARALGPREPADDELLLVAELDLFPGRRAHAGQVARRRILGDDALQAQAPRAGQGAPPVGTQAAGEPQDGGFAQLALEDRAALDERAPPQIAARARRGSRRPRRPPSRPRSPWSSPKRETARASKTTASPSRTRVGAGQRGHRGGDRREPLGAVDQVARQEGDARAVLVGDEADAVVLLLVDPAGPVERVGHRRGQHRPQADGKRRRDSRRIAVRPRPGRAASRPSLRSPRRRARPGGSSGPVADGGRPPRAGPGRS